MINKQVVASDSKVMSSFLLYILYNYWIEMKNVLTTREIEPTTIDEAKTVCSPLFICNILSVTLFFMYYYSYILSYTILFHSSLLLLLLLFWLLLLSLCFVVCGKDPLPYIIYHIIATIKKLIYFATRVPSLFIITASPPGNTANFGSSSL